MMSLSVLSTSFDDNWGGAGVFSSVVSSHYNVAMTLLGNSVSGNSSGGGFAGIFYGGNCTAANEDFSSYSKNDVASQKSSAVGCVFLLFFCCSKEIIRNMS